VTGVILDWTPEKAAAFGKANLQFRHALHERPLFSDEGLAEALHRYPRDHLGVFTMGDDPVAWRSWRRGSAEGLSGDQLLDAVKTGRVWYNLRNADKHLPTYGALTEEVFADKAANAGVRALRRDLGLLISSPGVQVFYHLDTPLVSLWQVRGQKRVWVYPPTAPFVTDEQLERIVLRESAEQFAYDPAWDAAADVFDLTPGVAVTWRQNAPHRIENAEVLNVSLSFEFMTPRAMLRANVIYGAGVLRRRTGLKPTLRDGAGPGNLAKAGVARAAKALKLQTTMQTSLPATFRVDPLAPHGVAPLW